MTKSDLIKAPSTEAGVDRYDAKWIVNKFLMIYPWR